MEKEKDNLRAIVRKWRTNCGWKSMEKEVLNWGMLQKKSLHWKEQGILQWLMGKGVLNELPKTQVRKRKRKQESESEEDEDQEGGPSHKK